MARAFTLIELLVTIAILAVVASGVVAIIDPQDKIRQANDAKIQSDIGQLATALQAYATSHDAQYPCKTGGLLGCPNGAGQNGLSALVSGGELVVIPSPPNNWTCNGGTTYEDGFVYNGTSVELKCDLRSKKYVNSGTPVWGFCSAEAQIGPVVSYTVGDCP